MLAALGGEGGSRLISAGLLPGMGVPGLPTVASRRHPSTRVLLVSGYGDAQLEGYGLETGGWHLLRKPFGPTTLLHAVRDALDAPSDPPAGQPDFEPG